MPNMDDIAVLTSENVRLNYTLAGMGSRTVAFILDAIIVSLTMTGVIVIFIAIDPAIGNFSEITSTGQSFLGMIFYILIFLIIWGYYFFFEWLNWGQTPGKAALGIRVASADGGPAGVTACAIRNIVRLIDLMLAIIGVTFFVMIFTPRYQRLGDLAAGTVVVKRRQLSFDTVLNAARSADQMAIYVQREAAARAQTVYGHGLNTTENSLKIRIDDSERVLIEKFIERRYMLPADVRVKLARDLASRIRSRLPGDALGHLDDEPFLETALAANPRL